MDSQNPEQALALMEPELKFLIALPSGETIGESREDFAKYIAGRDVVDRVHHVLRHAVDGDTETVYGVVTDEGRFTGAFLSAARLSDSGRIARYQAFFTTSFQLIDWSPK
jgi:hypothetical protein